MAIRPLDEAEHAFLDQCRENARYLAGTSCNLGFSDLQGLYDVFLARGQASEIAIAAIGVSFGDLLIRERPSWMEWRTQDGEEQGHSEQCVAVIGYELACHPVSMIARRLDELEAVDLEELAAEVLERITTLAAKGAKQRWEH